MKPCLILASAFSSQSVPHPVPSPYQIPPFWGSALMIHPTLVLPSPVPCFTAPGPGWNQTLLHPWQLPVCCSSRELIWPILTHVTHPWFPVFHSTQPALYFSYTHHLPGLLHATCLHTPCSGPCPPAWMLPQAGTGGCGQQMRVKYPSGSLQDSELQNRLIPLARCHRLVSFLSLLPPSGQSPSLLLD